MDFNDAPRKKKEQKPKAPKKITARYLQNSGLYYLKRFTASSNHFRFIMMRKIKKSCAHHKDQNLEECAALLEGTVKHFEELGFLNDSAYAVGMVTSLRKRGQSRAAILAKLSAKGLSREQIKTALDKIDDGERSTPERAELRAAVTHARKKRLGPFTRSPENGEDKLNAKALGSLARAGYSYDLAKKVLLMEKDEAEEILRSLF